MALVVGVVGLDARGQIGGVVHVHAYDEVVDATGRSLGVAVDEDLVRRLVAGLGEDPLPPTRLCPCSVLVQRWMCALYFTMVQTTTEWNRQSCLIKVYDPNIIE